MHPSTNLITCFVLTVSSLKLVNHPQVRLPFPGYYPASLIHYPDCPTQLMEMKNSFLHLQTQLESEKSRHEAEIARVTEDNIRYGNYVKAFIESVNSLIQVHDPNHLGRKAVSFPDLKGVLDIFEQLLREKAAASSDDAFASEREALIREKLSVQAQLNVCRKEVDTANEFVSGIKQRVTNYATEFALSAFAPEKEKSKVEKESLNPLAREAASLARQIASAHPPPSPATESPDTAEVPNPAQ